jgi:hypothetical protein
MSAPRFSIVIPTRERPQTLEHTLTTCQTQQGAEFEIVVSDNFCGPTTRELVERRADPRIRYVRTPSLLAMTDSLEFAVSQARGEYVIIQGDDDGLLRHALPVIDEIIKKTNTQLLRWECLVYNWPDVNNPYFQANTLLLPLPQTRTGHALRVCNSRTLIQAAANAHVSYSALPVIYNAVIHRDLLAKLRSKTGRVFKTRTPDVHAAFALAALVDEYHSLLAPLGICGRSGASTGVARHFCKKGSAIDNDFRRLNSAAGLELHPWVPDLPPIPSAVADAFLRAKSDLFCEDNELVLDRARLIRNCLREMEIDTLEEWHEIQVACRQSLADSPELLAWFEQEYGARDFKSLERVNRQHNWKRYGEGYLHLDTAEFSVRTVEEVAGLCERLLGYQRDGLIFQQEKYDSGTTSLSELQVKEALIQRLHRECQQLSAECEMLRREAEARLNDSQQLSAECEMLRREAEARLNDSQQLSAECEMLRREAEARLNLLELRGRQVELLDKAVVARDSQLQAQHSQLQAQLREIELQKQEVASLTKTVNERWYGRIRRLSRKVLKRLVSRWSCAIAG